MNATGPVGYANEEPAHAPPWHGLVVWDVFFNALTTGLFMTTAVGELTRPELVAPVAVWAYPLALVLLLIDLTLLVLDLGDPLRFHHMLRVFKPSSPMSLGTWCLTLYSLPLTLVVAVEALVLVGVLPDLSGAVGWVHKIALVVALPFAFGSMAYKGVLFSTSAQPGWREARWFGAYHVASAFALGSATLLGLATASGHHEAVRALWPAGSALAVIQLVPLGFLATELRTALATRYARSALGATAVAIGAGALVPLALFPFGGASVIAAAILVLGGGWVVRALVVMLPAVHEAK
ncbi:Polysulfide reductase, NrfD [Gemmata sp. SH-PL17]|uniref:NrfD/PsrC family molybdoenzyme membrane anchor subunit n=1 Tax=Gemmata sp. SH-PL17 TaxID=1630693 RepID=UPI00078D42E7|nr:NrfD/PsrC family molybdoenzyme membrane anchor subunit [Gemmata sp. SH-PL17]AMV25148.1 Polysulfide reductase, NrfD [Gemmata sp. SH-PL17]